MTPIQIAVLAMAYAERERGGRRALAVWGSWQRAAKELGDMLEYIGSEPGSRELEWKSLHGKHRKGTAGRPVHLYQLSDSPEVVHLATRCHQAVRRLPKGRQHATWKDVKDEVVSRWGPEAKRCPRCKCIPGLTPCTIVLRNGCGEGDCVPAGVFYETCSACEGMQAVA